MAEFLIGADEAIIDFDATTRLDVLAVATVTTNPVERGVDLADHLRADPLQIEAEFVVTATPLLAPIYVPTGIADRVAAVTDRLRAAQASSELLTLESTALGIIPNLAVTEVRRPVRNASGETIPVRLVQIEVATARTITIEQPREPRGAKRRPKGRQPAKETADRERASAISRLTDFGIVVE